MLENSKPIFDALRAAADAGKIWRRTEYKQEKGNIISWPGGGGHVGMALSGAPAYYIKPDVAVALVALGLSLEIVEGQESRIDSATLAEQIGWPLAGSLSGYVQDKSGIDYPMAPQQRR